MTVLLDVNVLIALIDPSHVSHAAAHGWFSQTARDGWATCPIVENGVVRILSHSAYPLPDSAGFPSRVAKVLRELRRAPGYTFWADDLSLLDTDRVDLDAVLGSRHVTDTYLLALAVKHGGKLATFDRRLKSDAVKSGAAALHIIATEGF